MDLKDIKKESDSTISPQTTSHIFIISEMGKRENITYVKGRRIGSIIKISDTKVLQKMII